MGECAVLLLILLLYLTQTLHFEAHRLFCQHAV